jgi:hypothetical protein
MPANCAMSGQQVNEACVGYLDKVLIVDSPHSDLLLPQQILAHNQRADAFLQEYIIDEAAGGMQVVLHAPGASGR